jgi:predicted dehydrogenase
MLLFMLGLLVSLYTSETPAQSVEPLRLGIVGLVHGHVNGFLRDIGEREDLVLVGVSEPNEALRIRYARTFASEPNTVFADLETMLDATRPEAVAVFTTTFDHLRVVEACARRGIHVMMEKPLAVSVAHGRAMAAAARDAGIHVLVNYETTWYPSNHAVFEHAHSGALGAVRRIIVRDGHRGPKEIGVSEHFLEWLTDPELNGAGALFDFGCYGANLITWLLGGSRPTTVSAVTQQLKSDPAYARVDDEATIVLTYPGAQGIIQASWNWPFSRKDLSLYGETGYVHADDAQSLRLRQGVTPETAMPAPLLQVPAEHPLSYLRAVVRGDVEPDGLSSLEHNLIVTEILEAARRSANEGITVLLGEE